MKKFFIFFLIFILDQATKFFAVTFIAPGETIKILPFFNLCLHFNTGVSFGFLSSSPYLVIAITLICLVFLLYLWAKFKESRIALTVIFSAAMSNLLDRFTYGGVVDFLDFFYKSWHWPAFNLADVAICLTTFFLIFPSHPARGRPTVPVDGRRS